MSHQFLLYSNPAPLESVRLHEVTACTLAINQFCTLAAIFLILHV